MIKVSNLQKYFFRHKKNEIHVLNDMTLSLPESGLIVLLGPSGSGKTTLLNVIGGLDKVSSGTIEFDEQIIKKYDAKTWDQIRNEKIGYIFQNYNLLPQLTVYENIALVLKMMGINDPEIIEKRVHYILNAVNMYTYRKKKSTQLSGGQQQRVAIARALVKNPEVIIADEPTGNLDSKNTIDIMNIIKEISKQKLVVLVTHEKELANVYGDRIIEIQDGQIINDHENDSFHEHSNHEENTIYLKDLNQITELKNETLTASIYQDSTQGIEPILVRLIIKNRTLYLDLDSSIQKVQLINASSNLVIKDEHYIKKNKEEMLQTSFDTSYLDNKEVKRSYKTVVSIKTVFLLALQKLLYTSKKGKIMLFSFIISGAVIASMLSMAAASYIPDYDQLNLDERYLHVSLRLGEKITLDELITYSNNDANLYINTLMYGNLSMIDPLSDQAEMIGISEQMDILEHAPKKMVLGRVPELDHEILITKGIADEIIQTKGAEYGIWNYSHLLIEKYQFGNKEVKITGIIESDRKTIFISRSLSNLISAPYLITGEIGVYYYGISYLNNMNLSHGVIPSTNQVAISSRLFNQLSANPISEVTFPLTLSNYHYVISGVFLEDNKTIAVGQDTLIEQIRLDSRDSYYIYSDHHQAMLKAMVDDNFRVDNIKASYLQDFERNAQVTRVPVTIITFIVMGLTLLGFYFIIHSSMVSRIYEISVYRALGMKKLEIFSSFLVEILIISTVTTFLGFVLAFMGLTSLSSTLMGELNLFLVNPLIFMIGTVLVYLINIVGGMFPIMLLLRKTPAQILAQYDI